MLAKMKSRKVTLGICIVLILALAAGITYAWFTATSGTESGSAELGRMAVQGEFEADTEDILFQPGDEVDVEGAIKNTGSLAFMAKVTLTSTTTIFSDMDGNPLPEGGSYPIANDPNVSISFDGSELTSKLFNDGSIIAWYKHKTNENEYYVVMEPGKADDLEFAVLLDGPGMGNHYMNATVSFGNGVFATQTRDGAVQDAWGINRATDLELLPVVSVGRMAGDPTQAVADRVEELFS